MLAALRRLNVLGRTLVVQPRVCRVPSGTRRMGCCFSQRRQVHLTAAKHDANSKNKESDTGGLERIAKLVRDGQARKIVVMVGAGISVSSGIPDFRTPGTGLYDNLQKYDLPYPEAIFDLAYFQSKPEAFNLLAKELYPGNFEPTPTHYFLKLLHEKGVLRRCFTQNIDSLEALAGLPKDAIVAAHGNFDGASCIRCGTPTPAHAVRATLMAQGTPRCAKCDGLVKANIVFFGEALPHRFFSLAESDLSECDLLLVIGTSLQVHPFAGLVSMVSSTTPRLLINREVVGEFQLGDARDECFKGDCDDAIHQLADLIGWRKDFDALLQTRGRPL